MSHSTLQTESFKRACIDAGLGWYGSFLQNNPQLLLKILREKLNFTAKYLAKATGEKRSSSYETIAVAGAKFGSWHHLSSHLSKAQNAEPYELPEAWFNALIPLIPLLVNPDKELAIKDPLKAVMEAFWDRVANYARMNRQKILDQVGTAVLGGTTWEQITSRSPLDAAGPLYTFQVSDDGKEGVFRTSNACGELIRELDDLWQGYGEMAPKQQTIVARQVLDLARRRPDFLEAGLAVAEIKRLSGEADAEAILAVTIAKAEGLMPAKFRGRVLWAIIENRFYHRLLWMQLTMDQRSGKLEKAIATAQKMLRQNPNDNIGVRHYLPLLYLRSHEWIKADKACNKSFRDEAAMHGNILSAITAFVDFANNRHENFRRALLHSLFTFPLIRSFLDETATPPQNQDDAIRGVIPDIETFDEFAWPAVMAIPGLKTAAQSLIRDKQVVAAEQKLRDMWRNIRYNAQSPVRVDPFGDWTKAVGAYALELSKEKN